MVGPLLRHAGPAVRWRCGPIAFAHRSPTNRGGRPGTDCDAVFGQWS